MQGFNMGRYHAPASLDSALSADNPPAKRLRTTPAAPPTVRFEMPFAIWCSTCPKHSSSRLIGQGVRFNARKTRIGAYYSTPIWSFELKHTACGGRIEIRTDPAEHDFVVTEGAQRRDTGDDAVVAERTGGQVINGGGMVQTREQQEQDRARQDAFAAFEGKKERMQQSKSAAQRLEELQSSKDRDWRDPDAANRRLRTQFRSGRRTRDRDRERGETLAEQMGFGFELLESNTADARHASLVEFSSLGPSADAGLRAAAKPLFAQSSTDSKSTLKSSTRDLRRDLVGYTRASLDPFGARSSAQGDTTQQQLLPGLRRKVQRHDDEPAVAVKTTDQQPPATALVEYDSD